MFDYIAVSDAWTIVSRIRRSSARALPRSVVIRSAGICRRYAPATAANVPGVDDEYPVSIPVWTAHAAGTPELT
jgi:hypothetical protein